MYTSWIWLTKLPDFGYVKVEVHMIWLFQQAACCDLEDKKMEPGSSRGLKKTLKKQCPARVNPPRQVARRACKKLEIDESSETSTSQDSDERDDPHRSLGCDATRKTEGDQHAIAMVIASLLFQDHFWPCWVSWIFASCLFRLCFHCLNNVSIASSVSILTTHGSLLLLWYLFLSSCLS